jgi:hypothetical protein
MAYERTTWEDSPSTATPINAERLNKIEEGIVNVEATAEECAKNLPYKMDYKTLWGKSVDFDTITNIGIYSIVYPTSANSEPPHGGSGLMIVQNYNSADVAYIMQLHIDLLGETIYQRRYGLNKNITNGGGWGDWVKVADDLSLYALTKDVETSLATKTDNEDFAQFISATATQLEGKADKTEVDISLATKANTEDVEKIITGEADLNIQWKEGYWYDTTSGVLGKANDTWVCSENAITGDGKTTLTCKKNTGTGMSLYILKYKSDDTYDSYILTGNTTYSQLLEDGYKYHIAIRRSSNTIDADFATANYFFKVSLDLLESNEILKKGIENVTETAIDEKTKDFDGAYILLDFDETIYNSDYKDENGRTSRTRQNLLAEYGYKGTLSITPSYLSDKTSAAAQICYDTVNNYDWDYACYGMPNVSVYNDEVLPNVSNMDYVDTFTNNLNEYVKMMNDFGLYRPIVYACRNNTNGTALATACKNAGFKFCRCNVLNGESIDFVTKNKDITDLSIGTYQFYKINGTDTVKSLIDDVVANKGVLSIMTHKLYEQDSNAGNGDNTIANYRLMLDYIKDYENQGKVKVITWSELCAVVEQKNVLLTEVDYERLITRIEALEEKE